MVAAESHNLTQHRSHGLSAAAPSFCHAPWSAASSLGRVQPHSGCRALPVSVPQPVQASTRHGKRLRRGLLCIVGPGVGRRCTLCMRVDSCPWCACLLQVCEFAPPYITHGARVPTLLSACALSLPGHLSGGACILLSSSPPPLPSPPFAVCMLRGTAACLCACCVVYEHAQPRLVKGVTVQALQGVRVPCGRRLCVTFNGYWLLNFVVLNVCHSHELLGPTLGPD